MNGGVIAAKSLTTGIEAACEVATVVAIADPEPVSKTAAVLTAMGLFILETAAGVLIGLIVTDIYQHVKENM